MTTFEGKPSNQIKNLMSLNDLIKVDLKKVNYFQIKNTDTYFLMP